MFIWRSLACDYDGELGLTIVSSAPVLFHVAILCIGITFSVLTFKAVFHGDDAVRLSICSHEL